MQVSQVLFVPGTVGTSGIALALMRCDTCNLAGTPLFFWRSGPREVPNFACLHHRPN